MQPTFRGHQRKGGSYRETWGENTSWRVFRSKPSTLVLILKGTGGIKGFDFWQLWFFNEVTAHKWAHICSSDTIIFDTHSKYYSKLSDFPNSRWITQSQTLLREGIFLQVIEKQTHLAKMKGSNLPQSFSPFSLSLSHSSLFIDWIREHKDSTMSPGKCV